MSSPRKKLSEVDPSVVKTRRCSDKEDVLNQDSIHSKQTLATVGETSTTTNTSSRVSQVDASWSMNSLVPNSEGNQQGFLGDSFVLCSDHGANPWWEDLESPFKASKERATGQSPSKTTNDTPSELLKGQHRPSRSSKPSKRDATPKSPTRKTSGRTSDNDKDRQGNSFRRQEKDPMRQRTRSKSPSKARNPRAEYRRSLSQSSINDVVCVDLPSTQKSLLGPEHRNIPILNTKTRHHRSRSSEKITRRASQNLEKTDPASSSKPSSNSSSRRASTERRKSPARRPTSPRRNRNDTPRRRRNLSPSRPCIDSPTRDRLDSPVRTRCRSSPKKSKSSPVKENRRSKVSSRRIKSSSTGRTDKTEDDLLDFIAAQIRHLEETTDFTIDFTVNKRPGARRSSLDATRTKSDGGACNL